MSDLRADLVAVVAGNLVPLALVLAGAVDLADVLVCFAAETVLLAGTVPGPVRDRGLMVWAFLTLTLILGVRAVTHVTWDAGSVVGIGGCLAASAGGLWWARRSATARPVDLGTLLWRTAVLMIGGVVALGWVDDLAARGVPSGPTDGLLGPAGRRLNELVVALDLDHLAVAALALVAIKAWNEAAHATYRHLRPRTRLAPDRAP